MSKRILSMLLAIVMVVGMMQGMSITANAAPSVSTSNNGTVLTISGTGILNRNYLDGVNKGKVTTIVIGEGITEIAGTSYQYRNWSTFSGFSNVTTITIEGDLESVGNYAFYGCSSLNTINYQGTNVPDGSNASIKDGVTINVPAGYNSGTFGGRPVTKPHSHTWNYSVNRTTITATCSDWSCRQAGGSVTISAPSDLIFDGNKKEATLTYNNWLPAEPTIVYEKQGTKDADLINVTGLDIVAKITVGSRTASATYKITPKALPVGNVTISEGVTYNGTKQTPAIAVTGLTLNKDYTVSWDKEGFTDAGTYTATIEGMGNYMDEVTKTYTISPKKLTADNVTLTPASGVYDGSEQKPDVTVKDGGKTLKEGTDYTIIWAEGFKDAGDYAVTVKGKGNYDVETSVVKYYTINRVTASVTITPKTLEYTGAAQELITVEKVAGGEISYKLGDGEWSTAIPKATNADTYTVYYKIAEDKNHEGLEGFTKVTINPKALTEANVTISAGVTYNGTKQEPTIEVPGLVLGTDYTVSWDNDGFTNAGTYTATVAGKGNYTGSVEKTYTIAKAGRGTLTLKAPVSVAMPGNVIILTVEGNTAEAGTIQIVGEGVAKVDGLKVKIGEDVALGGKVTIKAVYAETTNYLAAETTEVELTVGMPDYSNEIADLEARIAELEKLVESGAAVDELAAKIEAIESKIATLEKLGADHATKAELEAAKKELTNTISAAIDKAVAMLDEADKKNAAALEKAVKDLKDLIAIAEKNAAAADAVLKAELEGKITVAQGAIDALAGRVTDAEAAIADLQKAVKDLENAIKAGDANLAAEIAKLNEALVKAEEASKAADAKLKQDLEDVKAGLTVTFSEAIKAAVAKLEKADKDNTEALAKAAAELDALIKAAEKNAAAADAALKKELEAEITAAKAGLTEAFSKALKEAEARLEKADKDNAEALAKAAAELDALIKAAEKNAAAADAALKKELEAEITAAKAGLTEAFSKALKEAEARLEKADKDNAEALAKAVADLENLIEAAKDYADEKDAALAAQIKEATDRIAALEDRVGSAEEAIDEIEAAIKDLEDADEANAEALQKAINRLNKAIEDAKTAAKDADARLERKLNKKIEDADKALNKKIDAVQKNLEKAKRDLEKAIAAGDKNLHDRITRLNDAMNAADTALKAADEALKKQLEEEIKAANDLIDSLEFRMDTAEDAIAVLDKAVEELKKVDAANAAAMKAAIEDLNKAIKGVKEFAEKSDAETKAALNEKINAAQTALEAKIAEIQANLDKAVEELKAADKANAEKLADAIARLKEAIAVAEAASAATDAVQDEHIIALKNEINRVAIDLEKAQANLEAALKAEIEALTSELKRAEEALKNAIDTKADEDAVNAAIAELQNEIAALEAAKNNYIAADAALKAEVEAAIAKAKQEAIEAAKGHIPYIGENGNWWIGNSDTGVDANGIQGETGKDGITPKLRVGSGNIWEVSYDNGKTWTSLGVSAVGASGSNGRNGRDGKDGVDGKDGITPQLRINEDTNMWEISYDEGKTWESLGVVATGADGVDGANGADGITPQLRINEKTNMWEVSYDEGATWTSMGVKATGADGSSNVLPLVISGISLAGMIAMLCIMLVDRKKRGLPVG